jgi:flagellar basal-body rod modification protein FlgD
VLNDSGVPIRQDTVSASKGSNGRSWDGRSGTGQRLPDGSYRVAVTGVGSNNVAAALPFTVVGSATGVTSENSAVKLDLGPLAVPFSAVRSVGN